MSSKSLKKAPAGGNGDAKHRSAPGRPATRRPDSKAAALTERAWKKTYENRGKPKAAA